MAAASISQSFCAARRFVGRFGSLLVGQGQATEGRRHDVDVRPGRQRFAVAVQPFAKQLRVGTEVVERLAQLVGGDAAAQHDAADLAPVQPLGELLDHGVGAVGRHAIHEQGAPRDADAERGPLRKQRLR